MKITKLLEMLNDAYPKNQLYYVCLFSDYSGQIFKGNGEVVIEWSNKKQMNEMLTKYWNELNGNTKEWKL